MEMAGLAKQRANTLGGIISLLVMLLCILIFVFTLNNMPAPYFIQLGTILAFILQELFLLMTGLAFWQRAKTGM